MAERALAYNPQFDINDALNLKTHSESTSQFRTRTRRNLETNLGERFNVEVSRVEYFLENGKLKNADYNEPFVDVIKRGVAKRLKSGNPCDYAREQAELLGFKRLEQKIREFNSDPVSEWESGTRLIIISPCGSKDSSYQNNFFDVYEFEEDGKIIMSRYPSKLSHEEFQKAAQKLDSDLPTPLALTNAFFLSHPITTKADDDTIFDLLKVDEEAIREAELKKLVDACAPLITSYLATLSKIDEREREEIFKTYNALLNYADSISRVKGSTPTSLERGQTPIRVEEVIKVYGSMQARTVTTGCGLQSGFGSIVNGQLSMISKSPFSVSEFGSNSEDHSDFPCPRCGHIITHGAGIKECPGCGLQATCG